jgi:cation diffusion facilitator family transporter
MSEHALAAMPADDPRYREMRRVTVLGAVANLLLSVGKVAAGILGQSQALVADGVHSLSDLLSDALVLLAAKEAAREADAEHPYGHGRFETAATVGVGALLLAVAAGLAWDAGRRLLEPESLLVPGLLALGAALASILVKEGLYQITMVVARRARSRLLKANAWHHRSDAVSSVVVVVGVGGAMAGLPWLDAAAAIVVALMVGKVGWDLGVQALRELVDTALDAERVAAIRDQILAVDGVRDLHLLKTRRMGADALVDVHILLEDPRLSVSEGHQISEAVRARLIDGIDEVAEVMVHIDPEDDEADAPNRALPLRRELTAALGEAWAGVPGADRIQRLDLHYLDGTVHVDVFLPADAMPEAPGPDPVREALAQAVSGDPRIGGLRVYYGSPAA